MPTYYFFDLIVTKVEEVGVFQEAIDFFWQGFALITFVVVISIGTLVALLIWEDEKMFCDVCGDIVIAAKPIKVVFPDGSTLEIYVCLDCWWKYFEGKSRKLKVARMLKILEDE